MTGIAVRSGRRLALLMAATLLAATLPVLTGTAEAEHFDGTEELDARSSISGAIAWSEKAFPDGATEAVIGRSDLFADSLASASLQDSRPLLLTGGNSLHDDVAGELERLGVRRVFLLGGVKALSDAVKRDLEAQGYDVARVSGPTRVETAIEIARLTGGNEAFLGRAFGTDTDATAAFADSLALGAWSADSRIPVLLTNQDRLPDVVANFIQGRYSSITVAGGQAAVGEAVLSQVRALGVQVTRVSGTTRFDTAVEIARARGFATAADASEVLLVDGQSAQAWTDGFPAAAYAGQMQAPILLANSAASSLPAPTLAYLKGAGGTKLVIGWTVSDDQGIDAAETMEKARSNQRSYTVPMSWKNVVRSTSDDTAPIWGHGEKDKTGTIKLTVDIETKTITYDFTTNATKPFVNDPSGRGALLIRRAPAIANAGDVMVTLPKPDDDGTAKGTVGTSAMASSLKLEDLVAKPGDFYVELYNAAKPSGAIRGQLPSGGADQLPEDPTLSGISVKEKDDVVGLNFNVPVFLSGTGSLGPGDFTVTKKATGASEATTMEVVPGSIVVASTVSGASSRIDLRIALSGGDGGPVVGDVVSVTLKASGAPKLRNLAGVTMPNTATTRRATTVADTVKPKFLGLIAGNGSEVVFLEFSEAVYTNGQSINQSTTPRPFTVLVNGVDASPASTYSLPALAKADRRTLVRLTLPEPVPAGAAVEVTLAGTATTGNAAFRDAAGNTIDTTVLSRSTTATSRTGGLSSPSLTDLLVAKGPSTSTTGQSQTVRFTISDTALPAGETVIVQLPTNAGITYSAANVTTPSDFSSASVDATNKLTLTSGSGPVPTGTVVSTTLSGIQTSGATGATVTSTPLPVTLRRSDLGTVTQAGFHRRAGVLVEGPTTALTSGTPTNDNHAIRLRLAGDLVAGASVTVGLGNLAGQGVDYSAPGVTVTAQVTDATSGGNATVTCCTGNQAVITPGSGGSLPSNALVTLRLNGAPVSSAAYAYPTGITVPVTHSGSPLLPAQASINILGAVTNLVAGNVIYDSETETQTIGFTLHGLPTTQSTVLRVTLPQVSTRVWYSTTQAPVLNSGVPGQIVNYQHSANPPTFDYQAPAGPPPADGLNVSLTATLDTTGAESRLRTVSAKRDDNTSSMENDTFEVTNAPSVALDRAVYTDGSAVPDDTTFGNDTNDQLVLTFTGTVVVTDGSTVYYRLPGDTADRSLVCGTDQETTWNCQPSGAVLTISWHQQSPLPGPTTIPNPKGGMKIRGSTITISSTDPSNPAIRTAGIPVT